MADNEKLLEAARMIQEHCRNTDVERPCPFSKYKVCKGSDCCVIGCIECFPEDWEIPKLCRWTESDMSMAKALYFAGYSEIKRSDLDTLNCMVKEPDGSYFGLPSAFFKAVKSGEAVQLSDIIAEGAEQ